MELIDAYVAEVGRRLPEKQRADIEREIRSMIEDTLEDESAAQGRPIDEEMLVMLLKRLGSPEKMAASYAPPAYLVGPALYPSYLFSLKLVLGIVIAAGTLGLVIATAASGLDAQSPFQALEALGKGFFGLINAGLQVVGVMTVVFAAIQRYSPNLKPPAISEDFDPRKLKTAPAPTAEPFSAVGLSLDIVLTIVALVAFNFYQRFIGIYYFSDGEWQVVPVLTAAFFAYVPLMSLLWTLEAILKGSVLAAGGWSLLTKWLQIGLKVLSLGMIYILLSGPDLAAVPTEAIINPGTPEFPAQLNFWINQGLRISLGIALVVSAIETVVNAVKLLLNPGQATPETRNS